MSMLVLCVIAVGVIVGCGLLGGYVAQQKQRSYGEGFLFGALLGPFGLLIEVLLPIGNVVPKPWKPVPPWVGVVIVIALLLAFLWWMSVLIHS
jgi:hypothetical protein